MGIATLGSRPIAPGTDASVSGAVTAGAVGGVAGTVISGVFHNKGMPKLPIGGPWAKATFGVGLMSALSTAALHATNRSGERSNSAWEGAAISSVAFGVPGIWIHGKENPFNRVPVASWKGTLGVAAIGAVVGALILNPLTQPARQP